MAFSNPNGITIGGASTTSESFASTTPERSVSSSVISAAIPQTSPTSPLETSSSSLATSSTISSSSSSGSTGPVRTTSPQSTSVSVFTPLTSSFNATSTPSGSSLNSTLQLTASPSAAQTSQASSSHKSSEGGSKGTIIGAAVGSVLGVALILLFAFLMLRRRRKSQGHGGKMNRSGYGVGYEPTHGSHEPKLLAVATARSTDESVRQMSTQPLPAQAEDGEIAKRIMTLTDMIGLHVENFYHDNAPQSLNPEAEARLSRFGTPYLDKPLAAALEQSIRPTTLIKHCMAIAIFERTFSPRRNKSMLLAPDLAEIADAAQRSATISASTTSLQASADIEKIFRRSQALLSRLSHDLAAGTRPLSQAQRHDANRLARKFAAAFAPWAALSATDADTQHDNRVAIHLYTVLETAVGTASWLLCQPNTFDFDWHVPEANADNDNNNNAALATKRQSAFVEGDGARSEGSTVALVPAMYKVCHMGTIIEHPQKMIDVVVQRS